MIDELQQENNSLRAANNEARALLAAAAGRLRAILQDEAIEGETPIEATTAMELALEAIDTAITKLKTARQAGKGPTVSLRAAPPGSRASSSPSSAST